jgi:hypothetical protein
MRRGMLRSTWRPDAVWGLGAEHDGKPVLKIFVRSEGVQCLRLDRIVQEHPGGYYAAYRSDADEPFLIVKDLNDAIGMVSEVRSFWKGERAVP